MLQATVRKPDGKAFKDGISQKTCLANIIRQVPAGLWALLYAMPLKRWGGSSYLPKYPEAGHRRVIPFGVASSINRKIHSHNSALVSHDRRFFFVMVLFETIFL